MRHMKKTAFYIAGFFALTLLSVSLSAEAVSDQTGDVYHWHLTEGAYGWDENVGNKPNIDITEISYTTSNNQVILTLKVAGSISNSELISYSAYLNTSDSNYYLTWNNGEGIGMATSTKDGSYDMDFDPEIVASGNTITATYDNIGTFETGIEVWGWAAEYTTYGDMSGEWWGDWAPESYAMYDDTESKNTGNTDNTDDSSNTDDISSTDAETGNKDKNTNVPPPPSGTPGFEFIVLLTSLVLLLSIIKKRK